VASYELNTKCNFWYSLERLAVFNSLYPYQGAMSMILRRALDKAIEEKQQELQQQAPPAEEETSGGVTYRGKDKRTTAKVRQKPSKHDTRGSTGVRHATETSSSKYKQGKQGKKGGQGK
jgi:hypothetical protein